jgi:RHS repeat-associated protein
MRVFTEETYSFIPLSLLKTYTLRKASFSYVSDYQFTCTPSNYAGVCLQNTYDYSPFGVSLDGRTVEGDFYRRGFNGMEKDDELKGKGNSYTTEFRQLDPRVGRWLSVDPKTSEFPWQSPYVGMDNNPILLTDPDGRSTETTIVGKNGKVIDVLNDGKTDIVQFNDADETKWKGKGEELMKTGKGKVVGQTIFWHDFMKTKNNSIYEFTTPAYGEKVLNNSLNIGGDNFNGTQIANANAKMYKDMVESYDAILSLALLAKYSRNGKFFDLKASLGYSKYEGVYMNTKNNLKVYTSLRVLGNMVFGANMEIARQQSSTPMSKSEFWKMSMVYVGGYNMKQNNVQGKMNYPYYGEHIMSGRSIWLGYWGYKFQTK